MNRFFALSDFRQKSRDAAPKLAESMQTPKAQFELIKLLGYTEPEARFLHLVATHSGYFLPRQFATFTGSHRGNRATQFSKKLTAKRHARHRRLPTAGRVFRLSSQAIYKHARAEGGPTLGDHAIEQIHARLEILDFVLQNPAFTYLESESGKVAYFFTNWDVPTGDLPSRKFGGRYLARGEERYFPDRNLIFFASGSSCETLTFSFFQGPSLDLNPFARHLESYLPLFHRLPRFDFWFLARHEVLFARASEVFREAVTIPLQSNPSSDLLRYFRIRKVWESADRCSITENNLSFRYKVKDRFAGQRFENLYHSWKRNLFSDSEIGSRVEGSDEPHTVTFETRIVTGIGNVNQ